MKNTGRGLRPCPPAEKAHPCYGRSLQSRYCIALPRLHSGFFNGLLWGERRGGPTRHVPAAPGVL